MSVENFVGLRCHGRFYTGVIRKYHQQWMSKGSVGLWISRIGRVIPICDEVFFKIIVSFGDLVISNKVLLGSSCHIYAYTDMVVEFLEFQISVAFEFCLDEDFIEFWWADPIFEIPHASIFCRISTFQWWSLLVIRDHTCRILSLWWIHIVW